MSTNDDRLALLAVAHFEKLFSAPSAPSVPSEFSDNPGFAALHEKMLVLRQIVSDFASGSMSRDITTRGFVTGGLKALQSNLRHLTWQTQQVERGDFTQRVGFLGDFSVAFNNMVSQLSSTVNELKENEEALKKMAASLQKSEKRYRYLAEHDTLTNALNRRSFYEVALANMASASEGNYPCCVCMLDVDRFKNFNDTYGHDAGDVALQHVVQVAQSLLRQTDIMGRYGGEEFVFFFANTTLSQGMSAAQRIRRAIEHSPVPLPDGTLIPISASMGVAVIQPEWYDHGVAAKQLRFHIVNADGALYQAKQSGRNAVCQADETFPDAAAFADQDEKK
ncbi:MAG: diguanylate cyclase [Burkholderiaceae bacterium]|jgi:diguanylate cyclase (GGDEF)-like protein|nr:diguanylate cyclase [Burkholderiaceae bacterium]